MSPASDFNRHSDFYSLIRFLTPCIIQNYKQKTDYLSQQLMMLAPTDIRKNHLRYQQSLQVS